MKEDKEDIKDWTVIMYFAGNNNLREEMLFAVKEVFRVGPIENVDVVVLFNANGNFYEFKLTKGTKPKTSSPDRLNFNLRSKRINEKHDLFKFLHPAAPKKKGTTDNLGKANVTPPGKREATDVLQSDIVTPFIYQAIKGHRAKHYMLVLSGHGTGAIGDFLANERPMDHLTVPGMAKMLERVREKVREEDPEFKQFDILGLDSCLMSMAEVACEVAPYVRYMVANEGFDPATGWNYGALLDLLGKQKLRNLPDEEQPEVLARELLRTYIEYYADYSSVVDTSVDQSVLDLNQEKIKGFKAAVNELAKALSKGLDTPAVLNAIVFAHQQAQTYKWEQYTDLWDFCDILEHNEQTPEALQTACRGVKTIIEGATEDATKDDIETKDDNDDIETGDDNDEIEAEDDNAGAQVDNNRFVLFCGWAGAAFQHSHGVSIFFPWNKIKDWDGTDDLDRYSELAFTFGNNWDQFLRKYLEVTQRRLRERGTVGPAILSDIDRRSGLYGRPKRASQTMRKRAFQTMRKQASQTTRKQACPDDEKGSLAANITAKLPHMQNLATKWRRSKRLKRVL